MDNSLVSMVSEFTFGALFVALLIWVLRANDRREREMLDKLGQMTCTLQDTTAVIRTMQSEIVRELDAMKERRDL